MFLEKFVKSNKKNLLIRKMIIVAVWLVIWQAASMITGLELLFPGPVTVFFTLFEMVRTVEYYKILFHSLSKIGLGFGIAFVGGLLAGGLAGICRLVKEFLEPVLLLMKSLPVAAFIILVLIWFGSENAAVIISFMVVFPMIYHAAAEGIITTDKKLLEMAEVFDISFSKRLRYIYAPQIYLFLVSGLKTAAGMCWKAGISAEVIGLVKQSVGAQLYYAKLYLMTAELFAWSITIMVLSFIVEKLLLKGLELLYRVLCGSSRKE